MKEQAIHFQIDVDKFDVVRLALGAAHMARNNAFARSPTRCFQKKKKKEKDNDKEKEMDEDHTGPPVVRTTIETETPQVEHDDVIDPPRRDFIPPSGINHMLKKGTFELMDTASSSKNNDRDREADFNGPLFTRLDDDSPQGPGTDKPSDEWSHHMNMDSKAIRYHRSFSTHDNEDSTGKAVEDEGQVDMKTKDVLEYEEAAHYANDLVNANSLVEGMFQPVTRPLDSIVRGVMKSIENITPAWATQATTTDPSASSKNIIPPPIKQDVRQSLLQSEI